MSGSLSVYFDGACPLCTAEIAVYRRRSEDVAFVDVSDPATGLPADLPRALALSRFHVREPDGELLSGAAAFAALWRRTPGFRWLGRLAALPGLSLLFEGAYRGFLVIRPAIQRLVRRAGRASDGCECR